MIPEDISNHGQADLTVILENNVCLMEIKVVQDGAAELSALPKYRGRPETTVYEVGLVFGKTERNLVSFVFDKK
ncbi:MAG: hypothetical protein ACOZCE_06900 [Spirochaetota bacterium]